MSSIAKTSMNSSAADKARTQGHYRFKPLNIGRILIWGLFALALIVAPLIFTSSLALTMLSQIGYLIIICLSYNILLGQGGMLSFGHAVYTGLGSFLAIHAMNKAAAGEMAIPLVLIPMWAAWRACSSPRSSAM
jgi:branched-chain amino acid transport system permease protein